MLQVRVEEDEVFAAGSRGGREHRLRLPPVRPVPKHDGLTAQPRPRGRFLRGFRRPVGGTIVDQHDLRREIVLRKRRREFREQFGHVLGFVVRRDDDRDSRIVHTRLRSRAERIPSWSRYFATVRRAIRTPAFSRRAVIA